MNTNYVRVIPRDLFNEAKLLKCIGKLVLDIHDNQAPKGLKFEHDGKPFVIGLNDEGSLEVNNIEFIYKKTSLIFKTIYNSKNSFPLQCEYDYCDYLVFDENGNFDTEFLDFLKTI